MVFDFEVATENKRQHTESREDNHRHPIAARCIKDLADQQRHKAKTDILDPKNHTISRTENLRVMIFGTEGHNAAGTSENDTPSTTTKSKANHL